MKKLIPIILILSFLGGCAYTSLKYSQEDKNFAGVWRAENDSNAILKIYPKQRQVYLLHFESKENSWEGIGYGYGNKIISIFRYLDVNQQGFITFNLIGNNRLDYVSRNPDGSVRFEDYYLRP